MKLIRIILSGEFLFAFYLFVGSFKAALNLPIDETLLLLIITLFIALKRLYYCNFKLPKTYIIPIIIFGLIHIIAITSIIYTPSSLYATDKLLRFCLIAAWCYFGVFFLFKDEQSIKKFLTGIVVLSIIMSVSLLMGGLKTDLGFQTSLNSSYIALARVSAMGILIILMSYIFSKSSIFIKVIDLCLLLLFSISLIQSGARFPILIMIILFLILPFFMICIRDGKLFINKKLLSLFILFLLISTSFVILINNGMATTMLYRFEVLINQEGGGDSVIGRTDRFQYAWEMAKESNFIGMGIGSFPIYFIGMDIEDYPHNLYLEILAELGIFPLILFVSIIFLALYNGVIYYKNHGFNELNSSVYTIFLFWLINSFGSSSLTGDKVFYASIAIMIIMPNLDKNLSQKIQ